jgi:hypothetical protein
MIRFHRSYLLVSACLLLWLSSLPGCNAEPDAVAISIEAWGNMESHVVGGQRQRDVERSVRIGRFIDSRRDRSILGAKSGRWGALDSCIFTVKEGDLGSATARALSRYLKTTGWKIRTIDEGTAPKLFVSGEIIEMQVNASSNLFSTHVTTSVILLVEEEDQKTNKRSAARLSGSGSTNVLWFSADDAQFLLGQALTEAFQQWLSTTEENVNRQVTGAHLESN